MADTTPADTQAVISRVSSRYRIPGYTTEDLLQEAHLVALEVLPLYDPFRHGKSVLAYLYNRIRAHLSRLRHRERGWEDSQSVQDLAGADAPTAELAELAELHLPRRQARVIELSIQGHSDSDVAIELGISVGAVQTLRCRGISRLRERLAGRNRD